MVSGMGSTNARASAACLADHGAEALLSWGTAGGLAAGIHTAHVIIPEILVGPDLEHYPSCSRWSARLRERIKGSLPIHSGRLLQSNRVIASVADKSALSTSGDAIAVDMESVAVAEIARERGLRMAAIRVVIDDSSFAIPGAVTRSVDTLGRTRVLKLAQELLHSPHTMHIEIPALIRLGRCYARALSALQCIADLAGDRLCLD